MYLVGSGIYFSFLGLICLAYTVKEIAEYIGVLYNDDKLSGLGAHYQNIALFNRTQP